MAINDGKGGKPQRTSRSLIRDIPDEEGTGAPTLFKRSSFQERPRSIAARMDHASQQRSRTQQTASRPQERQRSAVANTPRSAVRTTTPSRPSATLRTNIDARPSSTNLRPSPTQSAWGMQGRENVGIGEMAFLRGEGLLTTHGLGSCVGVSLYDPDLKLGGLIHIMLPDSTINPEKARNNPLLFADTGLLLLLQEFRQHGGVLSRSLVRLAGGASTQGENDLFHIGKRNSATIRKLLWRKQVNVQAEDIGGNDSRTMMLDVLDGTLMIRIPGQDPKSL